MLTLYLMPNAYDLKLAIPYTQKALVRLLFEAGWEPTFDHGHQWTDPADNPLADVIEKGVISSRNTHIYAIRSIDIPKRVSLGDRDLALVGTDNIEEKSFPRIVRLGAVPLGRTFVTPPALEFWVHDYSPIRTLGDIRPGMIVLTDRPNFTARKLEEHGFKTLKEAGDESDPKKFREKAEREGSIAIEVIAGKGPPQLEDKEVLVIINETGNTKRNYKLREIGKLCSVETVIIANEDSLRDPEKRRIMEGFTTDIEGVHAALEVEANQASIGLERRLY